MSVASLVDRVEHKFKEEVATISEKERHDNNRAHAHQKTLGKTGKNHNKTNQLKKLMEH